MAEWQRTLHESARGHHRTSPGLAVISVVCLSLEPAEDFRAEYGSKGDIEHIIGNLVCPESISLDEPPAAEKGYYEEQCRYHITWL